MIKKCWPSFILFQLLLSYSCVHKTDLSTLKDVSYSLDIKPIMASNCTQDGCHNSHNGEVFSLESYDDLLSGDLVKTVDAHGSKLYKVITNHGGEQQMPPPPLPLLSSDQIKLVYVWIEQGAKNN